MPAQLGKWQSGRVPRRPGLPGLHQICSGGRQVAPLVASSRRLPDDLSSCRQAPTGSRGAATGALGKRRKVCPSVVRQHTRLGASSWAAQPRFPRKSAITRKRENLNSFRQPSGPFGCPLQHGIPYSRCEAFPTPFEVLLLCSSTRPIAPTPRQGPGSRHGHRTRGCGF